MSSLFNLLLFFLPFFYLELLKSVKELENCSHAAGALWGSVESLLSNVWGAAQRPRSKLRERNQTLSLDQIDLSDIHKVSEH